MKKYKLKGEFTMKKILIFFMFILSLTSLSEKLIVISKDGYANLREKASTNSKIKNRIDNSYDIINFDTMKEKDWYYVITFKPAKKAEYNENYNYHYGEGYIHESQVAIHPETYITSSKDGYINLRSRPSTSSRVLDNLGNGAYVTRYPEKTVGDWYYVDYNVDGGDITFMKGYIHKSQLKKYKE